jgi:Grap2 and cyclin-D-interacting
MFEVIDWRHSREMSALEAELKALSTTQQLQKLVQALDAQIVVCNELRAQSSAAPEWSRMSWSTPVESFNVALTVMKTAANSISTCSTRFTLLYKTRPQARVSAGLVLEIVGLIEHLTTSLTVVVAAQQGASPSLIILLIGAVRGVLLAMLDLTKAVATGDAAEARWNSLTGAVWESCKAVQSVPANNKLAVRLQLMRSSISIKDTMDEFVAALAAAAEGTSALSSSLADLSVQDAPKAAAAAAGDDFDDLVDYMGGEDDDELSSEEAACTQTAVDLLKTARACIKLANDALSTLPDTVSTASTTTSSSTTSSSSSSSSSSSTTAAEQQPAMCWAGPVCCSVDAVAEAAAELGVVLYPPLAAAGVEQAAAGLAAAMQACLELVTQRSDAPAATTEACAQLQQLLQERLESVRTAAAALD